MNFARNDMLKDRLHFYCNVNAFDLIGLKENLALPEAARIRDVLKSELADAVAGTGLTRSEYEKATGADFDDDADYLAYLQGIQAFLFENGKHP